MIDKRPTVTIYSDGACDPNPGPGGWAAVIREDKTSRTLQGSEPHTTNNRMELTAAVRSLESLPTASHVLFYTDSQYLMRGITEWLPRWIARNWRTTTGKVANQDLWEALVKAVQRHQIEWQWVRGHAGDTMNNQVDRLARQAIRR